MTNPFARLGLPESLLLDPASVEDAWRDLRRDGKTDEEAEASGNRARTLLSDPVSRLAAWLDLKAPDAAPDRAVAPELMDLFANIGPVLASTDTLLARHRKATTALARAVLAKEAVAAQLGVQGLPERFPEFERDAASGEFAGSLRALGQLKFLKRWEEQCRERLLALLST